MQPNPPEGRQHALNIGPLRLETPLLLAPMAGYSDLPFRSILRSMGGLGLAFTEMLSPKSLLFGAGQRLRAMLATSPEDRPLGHQIYGSDPDLMCQAARWLEERGAALIDVNMGCPQPEITSGVAGAALLRKPAEAAALVERIVAAVSLPVTVKLRLGWEEGDLVAPALARDLEKAGVAAVTVHGRTRDQRYAGQVDLAGIRRVVEAVERIPVIGNGDITSPEAAVRTFRETGCAGIMVGRGALRNPWLVRDLWRAMEGLPLLPPPTREERLRLLGEHFERVLLHYPRDKAVLVFRRWIPQRASGLGLDREAMLRLLKITEASEMRLALGSLEGWAASESALRQPRPAS